ncbi:hypothetical protein CH373_18430 [Leptospira perolatii]|uniref:DUF5009 domain-containing protein n=1 Tax=Leptospira perolatii TaxID=2023191 RepID=A0A2M9ZHX9_9LEPT|nr:DUF5009 domain-containing protein [Leptospira perolatii]PJZ68011.1 hypothetical protein CH360_18445 [Leptospira perolatii]PJZ71642.1 hypothetical protein CH373_18430 [Leptospira perolatii]
MGQDKNRSITLDSFRGLTVAGMILVNNPGTWSAIYSPLKHAPWNGCTPTDLVFPFFLFSVGASIPFSDRSKLEESHTSRIWKVLKRSLVLIFLGLVLHWFGDWSLEQLRIPGVLQRIGVVYFFSAILFFPEHPRLRGVLAAVILVLYWILLTKIPPPGIEAPSLEPSENWGAWLDRFVFGENHLWKSSKTWDPEGLLSTISAVASSLIGTFFGESLKKYLSSDRSKSLQISYLMRSLFASFVLCGLGKIWDLQFPINKSLWTSSYVLWTCGLAGISFSILFILEILSDFSKRMISEIFIPFGRNAILVFFGSGLLARSLNIIEVSNLKGGKISLKNWIFAQGFQSWTGNLELASFLYAFVNVLLWFGLLYLLDKKKWYWKI